MHTLHFCTLPTVQECKECTGVIPEFEMMTTEFFPGVPLHIPITVVYRPATHIRGAVPSVLPRTEITAMWKIP